MFIALMCFTQTINIEPKGQCSSVNYVLRSKTITPSYTVLHSLITVSYNTWSLLKSPVPKLTIGH